MLTFFLITIVMALTVGASLLMARMFGRSQMMVEQPGFFILHFILLVPACYCVYAFVPFDPPLIYAAYGAAGGLSAWVAQAVFAVKVQKPGRSCEGNDA